MLHIKNKTASIHKLAAAGLLLSGLLLVASLPGFARDKDETIDATAFGTGTQLGQNIGVTLNIYQFSTPADKTVLVQAYEKGQNQGLVKRAAKDEGRRPCRDHWHTRQRLLLYQDDSDADWTENRLCDESPDPLR